MGAFMQCIVKLPVVSNSDFGLTTAHGAAEDQEWVLKSERIRYREHVTFTTLVIR